jgi:hypothetical protein
VFWPGYCEVSSGGRLRSDDVARVTRTQIDAPSARATSYRRDTCRSVSGAMRARSVSCAREATRNLAAVVRGTLTRSGAVPRCSSKMASWTRVSCLRLEAPPPPPPPPPPQGLSERGGRVGRRSNRRRAAGDLIRRPTARCPCSCDCPSSRGPVASHTPSRPAPAEGSAMSSHDIGSPSRYHARAPRGHGFALDIRPRPPLPPPPPPPPPVRAR